MPVWSVQPWLTHLRTTRQSHLLRRSCSRPCPPHATPLCPRRYTSFEHEGKPACRIRLAALWQRRPRTRQPEALLSSKSA